MTVAMTVGAWLSATPVAAQEDNSGGVNDGASANNTPDGAEVNAQNHNAQDPPDGGEGSGGTRNITCEWFYRDGAELVSTTAEELDAQVGAHPDIEILVQFVCRDADTGELVGPPLEESQPQPWPVDLTDVIDEFDLAQSARDSIQLPVPLASTTPPVSAGSYAQLRTFFSIGNADQTLTGVASVPGVEVVVTANPVSQTWTVYESGPGSEPLWTATCALDAECSWIPEHSSAGQPMSNPWTGTEPCYYATVVVEWEMPWTINGVAGEPALDPGFVAASICLPVAEVQAVVSNG